MNNWLKVMISLALPQVAGLTGAAFTLTGEGSWYRSIQKPDWNPPGWLFAPVWTTLYILMGIAFYLVWKSAADKKIKTHAMVFWILQLVLNLFWTLIFFLRPRNWLCFCRDRSALVVHTHYHFSFCKDKQVSCLAASALYQLGEFCGHVNLHYMAIK